MFKTTSSMIVWCFFSATFTLPEASAQTLNVRQLAGGLIQVEAESGVNFLISPAASTSVPAELSKIPTLALGEDFAPRTVKWNGEPVAVAADSSQQVPADGLLIESVLIGEKRAGIQIQAKGLKVLVASLDFLSDQGYISTRQNEQIHLLVLTVGDAKKLDTTRTNLWISGIEVQQIALNSTSQMSVATMEKFYNSLKRQRTLPTAVLPMIQVPNKRLKFGDRQVVLLKQLD